MNVACLEALVGLLHAISRFVTAHKDVFSAFESLCKIVALAIGAWWAWFGFIRNRVKFPKANVQHEVQIWRAADKTFVHLAVRITNTGNVLMRITNGCAWLEQLSPLPDAVSARIAGGEDVVRENQIDAEWALIQKRDLPPKHSREIEPGETDQIDFDFMIEPDIQRILVYSHLPNPRKETVGWNLNTIHEIPSPT
jgi:hypothetical protein